ncbi:hypothetical protein AX16_003602 [Volvariella volvacea WC 439]|nr:hypothetical protein AX16_003602 [Volvariella volvacea WC 439]
MATYVSAPVPRRSSRLRQPNSPPPRRIVVAGNRVPSRYQTPAIRSNAGQQPGDRQASVVSSMDVDESVSVVTERGASRISHDTIFAKTEEWTATFYASLPLEVKQLLKNADFYRDAYAGDIDTLTGFALVASPRTCFVWQHVQAVKGTPTCYIFSCPQDEANSPPFHALVPYGPSREPGLILISPTGFIRLWDSIGIGLAGGENYTTSELELQDGELVTNLVRANPQTYIASTSLGNLFLLNLTSAGGKFHIAHRKFSHSARGLSISRLLPSFITGAGSSRSDLEPGNISAIALGSSNALGGRGVWALVDTRLQLWDMRADGWAELVHDTDVLAQLRGEIRETYGESLPEDDAQLDLEFLDLAVDSEGQLVVLLSYAGEEVDTFMALDLKGIRRVYVLMRLTHSNSTFTVDNVKTVPYQSTSTGAPMHPRIRLIDGGTLVSIQFGDAVALCARDSEFRDRLELKSPLDRTLGISIAQNEPALLILNASTMIRVTINLDKAYNFDPETGHTYLVKSTLTQAILYGSVQENPLHFSFPPEIDEEGLMQGAEQMSQAILESDPELVRRDHDMSSQLTTRKDRLSWLIRFINDNAALGKMSQRSRQQLVTNAEKLYAAHQLWKEHNNFLATAPVHSVLQDAVYSYMTSIGDTHHEDIMRTFFRTRVRDLGKLIRRVPEVSKQAAQTSGRDHMDFLPEANRIVLTVLRSAFNYRAYNHGMYGIELPMIRPWTSQPGVIEVMLELFDATTTLAEAPAEDTSNRRLREPVSQLPDLAATLLQCIQERLDWLSSSAAAEEVDIERDRKGLEQKVALLRPEVLETLRRIGYADSAFALAEQYRDFRSLAALCHRETVYPPEQNPHHSRIQGYLERFQDEFATELFRWYIQHGELRIMFAQDGSSYSHYMDKYFVENPNNAISWIHNLDKGRHKTAAAELLAEAKQTPSIEAKHLMLSIGKLCHLAQLQEGGDMQTDQAILDGKLQNNGSFHDDLDFVSVQETLWEEFQGVLKSLRGKQSLDSQVDAIARSLASSLVDRKALLQIFKDLVRAVIQKKALSIEDTVDVLTLKDNANSVEDYATALHLLTRAQNIPDGRKLAAFRIIWRRIYLHDDWESIQKTANITDGEVNTRYRNTALFETLLSILPRDIQVEGYETSPNVALIVPTVEEISSRWPGKSAEQINALVVDYNYECDKLGEFELDDVYQRVRELAVQQVTWEQ